MASAIAGCEPLLQLRSWPGQYRFLGAAGFGRYLTASDRICAELLARLWRMAVLDAKVIAAWLTSPG